MSKESKPVRATVYLNEQIIQKSQNLFNEAEVDNFSAFVRKSLEFYIDRLIATEPHTFLSQEIATASSA